MTKNEVKIGATYVVNHTSGRIHARILREVTRRGYTDDSREVTHWIAVNLRTGREIEIKSACKLVKEVSPDAPIPARRMTRDDIMRDMGLTKVRGALGGIYWE